MFKETPDGQTHSYNDRCGEPAHNISEFCDENDNLTVIKEKVDSILDMINNMNVNGELKKYSTYVDLHNTLVEIKSLLEK